MATAFDVFYENPNYIQYKRHLFNYQLRKRIIEKHLSGCGKPILDIGSGIAPMVPAGSRTFLSDMSVPGMRIMKGEGYECTILDIQQLGLRSGSVQTVVCSEVLEHIPQDDLALAELSRVLAPGGRLILTVPLHRYYWSKDDDVVGHCRRYNPSKLSEQLKRAGLRVRGVKAVGSILERGLTLSSVWLFQTLSSGTEEWKSRPTAWFKAANRLTAAALQLAAHLSPQATSSIGLFDCQKP
ncbi:MAG: class I SAM-dependent methyltransferase [Acidobacteria bacterium]|nr:MAG: class I SAM-dependent methyltransferase [Acidobacteriota bacterium]